MIEALMTAAGRSYDIASLEKSRSDAVDAVRVLRDAYSALPLGDEFGLAVVGSIGRHERTQGSDLDILILSERESGDPDLLVIDRAVAELAVEHDFELSNPHGHPKFSVYKASELAREIGGDADTNTLMTVRMCLLLESISVGGDAMVTGTKELLMNTYLANSLRDSVPPRFLLNEVVRFWRIRPFLSGRFEMRPVERLAAVFLEYDMVDDGARALQAYSDFLTIIDSSKDRDDLEAMNADQRAESPLWERVQLSGRHFHDSLTALLFDSGLGPTTREYAVL